jgi:hypothetical protein
MTLFVISRSSGREERADHQAREVRESSGGTLHQAPHAKRASSVWAGGVEALNVQCANFSLSRPISSKESRRVCVHDNDLLSRLPI